MEGKLFFGGMSTDIEIKKLMDAYDDLKPGDVVSHDDVERLLGVARKENRYRTVMARFKKMMLTGKNIEMAARHGEGYAVLSASERVRKVTDDTGRIYDGLRRVHYRIASVPRAELSEHEARRADHAQVLLSKICDDMAMAKKEIAPPARTDRLPSQGIA